jgi:hypothetical protein
MPEASFTTGLRNLLYALEWWVFGLLAIYVWWRYVRDALRADAAGELEGAGPEGAGPEGAGPEGAEKDAQEHAVTSGP